MRKIYFGLCICCVAVIAVWGFRMFRKLPSAVSSEHLCTNCNSYYVPISVCNFIDSTTPHLFLEIENTVMPGMLDLGFQGQLSLSSQRLSQIVDKTYLRMVTMQGIRGTEFTHPLYAIPNIHLGALRAEAEVLEENEQPRQEAAWTSDGHAPSIADSTRIGWKLFGNTNLFLDLSHSTVAVCDSLDTLQNEGYLTETFVKVPLLIDRGLVEVEGELLGEPTRFMLDTGASISCLNTPLKEGESIESMLWNPDHLLSVSSVKAGEYDLGPMDFRRIPIKLPVAVEAILGMDFFEEHMVFLDFAQGYIYFAKSTNSDSKNDGYTDTSESNCHPDRLQSAS